MLKRRYALENNLAKIDFKSITEALKYAYDNPDKVDYSIMKDFISKNQRTLIWKDNDLELLKAAKDMFIDNPEVTPKDMGFIDGVLHDHIGTVIENYAREFQTSQNITEFDVCKTYDFIKTLTNTVKKNPNILSSMNVKDSKGLSGFEWLNELKSMMERSVKGLAQHYTDLLKYRYRKDGTRQTFDEQMLRIVRTDDYAIDDVYLRKMIKHGGTFLQGKGIAVLNNIPRYRIMAKKENLFDFIDDVYKDNIPALLDSYEQVLASGEKIDEKQLFEDYVVASGLVEAYANPAFLFMREHGKKIGLYTEDEDIKKSPIERLQEIKTTLEKMPEVEKRIFGYKYKEDGSQRTLAEMIDLGLQNFNRVDLPFLQTVIINSDVAKQDNSLSMLEPLNKFIHVASEDREVSFINGVIKNCLPTCIENYAHTLDNKDRDRTDDDLIAYKNIVTYLNTSEKNKKVIEEEPTAHESQEGTEQEGAEETKKPITERLAEIKAMMDERWPGIEDAANKLDKKRNQRGLFGKTNVYDQLKNMKVSVVGKNKAAEVEVRMAEKKHDIEYDGK